eukprot:3271970-Rhodomonas_salina.2
MRRNSGLPLSVGCESMGFPLLPALSGGFLLIIAAMLQVIKPGAAALAPLPRSPLLFQLNTKVLLGEMSKQQNRKVTLDDFPDEHLEKIKNEGYDIVYFLGVWQTGEFGMKKSIKLLDCEPCMKGLPREAASSSPFAVFTPQFSRGSCVRLCSLILCGLWSCERWHNWGQSR